jgi:hypothetical protein
MFTFINTSILVFTIAIAIPLFIHLFNKQRKKKIKFGSIRFLQILEKQRLKRIKIYDYILILIRTLILLALIMAFARPTITSKSILSSKSARTTSIIIIDTGINMNRYDEAGPRFARLQSVLKRLIEKSNPEDDLYIIQSTSPEIRLTRQLSISDLKGSFVHGKWSSAFNEAMKLFKEHPNFNQELHIISDFQFMENAFEDLLPEFTDIRIFLIKIGSSIVSNLGIKTVEVKNQIFEVNKPIQIETQIINTSPEEAEPVEIHLFVDQQRMSHQRVVIEAMQSKQVELSFSPKSAGHLSGYVEINDDDLLSDNRYYFALEIPAELKLLFIDDNPSVFIKAALTSLTQQTDIQVITERYSSWTRQNFLLYDMLILSNFAILNPADIKRVKAYLENGGAILLIPGLRTMPSEYNKFVSALGISTIMKDLMSSTTKNEFFFLKRPNINHPLFSGLFRTVEPEISKPKFFRYFKIDVSPQDQVILSYQNNDPYLIHANHEKGSIFILSSYIDDEWTDIQYRGIFLPLLSRLVYFGVSNASQINSPAIVGMEKNIKLNYLSKSGEFYLQSPEGEKNLIVPQQQDQFLNFKMNNLSYPGMYHLFAGEDLIYSIPTNVESFAIHKPIMNMEQISNLETVELFSEDDNYEEAITQARFGSELWKIFIVLSLLLLGFELFFIKKMEGRVDKTTTGGSPT